MHVVICVLDSHTRPLRKKLEALPGTQLALSASWKGAHEQGDRV